MLLGRPHASRVASSLPPAVQKGISSCRMISLDKGEGNIRPLGLGVVIRRIATRALNKVFLERVRKKTQDLQAGFGPGTGCGTGTQIGFGWASLTQGSRMLVLGHQGCFHIHQKTNSA